MCNDGNLSSIVATIDFLGRSCSAVGDWLSRIYLFKYCIRSVPPIRS
jgi:hypothetical protein